MADPKSPYGITITEASGSDSATLHVGFYASTAVYGTLAADLGLTAFQLADMASFERVNASRFFTRLAVRYQLKAGSSGSAATYATGKVWCNPANVQALTSGTLTASAKYRGFSILKIYQPLRSYRA